MLYGITSNHSYSIHGYQEAHGKVVTLKGAENKDLTMEADNNTNRTLLEIRYVWHTI